MLRISLYCLIPVFTGTLGVYVQCEVATLRLSPRLLRRGANDVIYDTRVEVLAASSLGSLRLGTEIVLFVPQRAYQVPKGLLDCLPCNAALECTPRATLCLLRTAARPKPTAVL